MKLKNALLCVMLTMLMLLTACGGKDDTVSAPVLTLPADTVCTAVPARAAAPTTEVMFPDGREVTGLALGNTVQQKAIENELRAKGRPAAQAEGWLPVFTKAATTDKIIAITVDDCAQAGNLRQIIDTALEYGQKLTFFPIGENVEKAAVGETLKYAWQHGMELENHTYTHNPLYASSADELAVEVSKQNYALCKLLGVNYQCHFLRPKGGDARADQRIHTYIDQLGYYGVAHWAVSGTQSISGIAESLAPGNIYLFHTTDKDLARLQKFIPYAVEQGYSLVTLNELFGYPENETGEFISVESDDGFAKLRAYDEVYVTLSKGSHSWLVKEMQDALYALGYLETAGDGIFGDDTKKALTEFETARSLKADGKAEPSELEILFAAVNG